MGNIVTPVFRAAWVNLIKPRKNDQGEDRWGCTALFKKGEDLTLLKKIAKEAMLAKWGKQPKKLKTPFHDQGSNTFENEAGEEVLYAGYEEGAIYVNLNSRYAPEILDKKTKSEIIDESEIYSGVWLQASVEAYAYDHKASGKGVAIGLRNVLKVRDDTPFGKIRVSAEDDFTSLLDADSDDSSSESADDTDDMFG